MKNLQDKLTPLERFTAPTPKFFKVIQAIGIVLAGVSGALIYIQGQGVELPALLAIVADKATVISGVIATIVSQLTVDIEAFKKQ